MKEALPVSTSKWMSWEETAKYSLSMSHETLRYANWLESHGYDGDAYLARENAYWYGQDATHAFGRALQERNQRAQTQLDTSE
jgi:hypothetical protein